MIYKINKSSMVITRNNIPLEKISILQFKVLYYLIINKNKVLSRESIIQHVWGNVIVNNRTVDVHIAKLRSIIDTHNDIKKSIISSIDGVGYKFIGNIEIEGDGETEILETNGIEIGIPYYYQKDMVIPLFISESNFGKLVTFTNKGKFFSLLTNEFLNYYAK